MTLLPITLAQWLGGFLVLGGVLRGRRVGPARVAAASLSVIIPARDEGHNLPRLLASLAVQPQPPREIIVVDDHSTDGTADVARDAGATVVTSAPLPAGWKGKTWACAQGAAAATGDTLFFIDADTWFEADGLASILAAHPGGALSVCPYHAVEKPHEQLSAFFNLLMTAGTGAFTLWRRAPRGLVGQMLLVSREDYHRAGGHASVKDRVLENFYLAEQFRAAGVPIHCAIGKGACAMRMYPGNVADLIEGWTKGFAAGAARTPPVVMLVIVAWLGGMIVATSQLTSGWPGAAAAAYVLYAAQLFAFLRRLGAFRWYVAALFPAPLFFYFVVFARSVLRRGRHVTWKGRVIDAH